MANEKARIAIVGTGWWATTVHFPALKKNPDAELVAAVDRRPEMLNKAHDAYGPFEKYTSVDDMLKNADVDGVIVATNHSTHYEVVKAALEAGKHVLVEKPMVLKADEAHELVQLARDKGVELIVGYPWHYTERSRKAREIIQSGVLGPIQYVSCLFSSMVVEFLRGNDAAYAPVFGYPVTGPGTAYSDPKLSGGGQGVLQVTHSAGTLFFVTGLIPQRVSSFMENFGLNVDLVDSISVKFTTADGHKAVGVLGSTGNIGVGDPGSLELRVFCEKGHLRLEQIDGSMTVRYEDGHEDHYDPLPAGTTYLQEETSNNLVQVILGRQPNYSPGEVGMRVVELLDAAYQSAAQDGAPIAVNPA